MPEINVERKGLDIDYHLESIIAEMLRNNTAHFIDRRNYTVTLQNDENYKETVTAKIEIELEASDDLLEKASAEE